MTKVIELIKNLKHHTDETPVIIKDIDGNDFQILNIILKADGLNIVLGYWEEPEDDLYS